MGEGEESALENNRRGIGKADSSLPVGEAGKEGDPIYIRTVMPKIDSSQRSQPTEPWRRGLRRVTAQWTSQVGHADCWPVRTTEDTPGWKLPCHWASVTESVSRHGACVGSHTEEETVISKEPEEVGCVFCSL